MSEERPKSQFMLPDPPEGKATATKPMSPIALPKSLLEAHSLQQTDTDHQGRRKGGAQPHPHPPVTQGSRFLPPGSQESSQLGCWRGKEGEGFRGWAGGAHNIFSPIPSGKLSHVVHTTLREPGKCIQVTLQEEEDGVLATNSCLCHIIR